MKRVFEEVNANGLKLKNRLVRSATWEGLGEPDGSLPEEVYEIYEELAKGGVGAIITGFTSVSADDFYFNGMMRLSSDALIPQYKRLTDIIHKENCPVIAQLALGAFYRVYDGETYEQTEPDEMTKDEIRQVIRIFGEAARRAKEAGFDGVQIHAAHFFFLSRFISPAVNHRTDEYGGSTENRSRILTEILHEIRKEAPGLHVTVKINSSDFTRGGLMPEESLKICRMLADKGIDSIEVSGNGTSVGGIRPHINEAYFKKFAAKLADTIDIPVILVGGLRSIEEMQVVLNDTRIELLSLSRPLLREPELPKMLESGECSESKCVSCNACYSSKAHRCVFRR